MTPKIAPKSPFIIRRVKALDAESYCELRLEGLKNNPEAFGASFKDEARKPLSWFEELLEKNTVLGGFTDDGTLVGVVGFKVSTASKLKHKGVLWGMFIKPEARRTGLARLLVERVIEHAKSVVEEVMLSVVASNVVAVKLYERLEFEEYGLEHQALKIGNEYHDEILMRLPFGN
ncbi:MAG: GNAT family N-acetyltransferase [Halopseudomonas aestusnigri]